MNTEKDKINYDLISNLTLEVAKIIELISKCFPRENEKLLKHLSASAIHTAFFMRDVYCHKDGVDVAEVEKLVEDQFLKKCGCGFNKK